MFNSFVGPIPHFEGCAPLESLGDAFSSLDLWRSSLPWGMPLKTHLDNFLNYPDLKFGTIWTPFAPPSKGTSLLGSIRTP